MDLSALCRICNINIPKYTCPRCSLQTCSLACSRKHKLWADCSGVRDPTVFKPRSELLTPSGVDHDYNFLHAIEHGIERKEKEIVEERKLVLKRELDVARNGGEDERQRKRHKKLQEAPGEAPARRALEVGRIRVEKAPKAMKRAVENETSWSRNARCINWQVEWLHPSGDMGRFLAKAMGNKPIGESYTQAVEDEKRKKMSEEERRTERKRRAAEAKERAAKRLKLEEQRRLDLTTIPTLQDPDSGAWNFTPVHASISSTTPEDSEPTAFLHNLYLLRPHTKSSYPKVLTPLDPSRSLDIHLRERTILEFPTIYVLEQGPRDLPGQFMLEKDYLAAIGEAPVHDLDGTIGEEDESVSSEEEEKVDYETSSSGSSDDEDEEEGEVL
jgi:hypothetical protein